MIFKFGLILLSCFLAHAAHEEAEENASISTLGGIQVKSSKASENIDDQDLYDVDVSYDNLWELEEDNDNENAESDNGSESEFEDESQYGNASSVEEGEHEEEQEQEDEEEDEEEESSLVRKKTNVEILQSDFWVTVQKLYKTMVRVTKNDQGRATVRHIWNEFHSVLADKGFSKMIRALSVELKETCTDPVAAALVAKLVETAQIALTYSSEVDLDYAANVYYIIKNPDSITTIKLLAYKALEISRDADKLQKVLLLANKMEDEKLDQSINAIAASNSKVAAADKTNSLTTSKASTMTSTQSRPDNLTSRSLIDYQLTWKS